VRKHGASFVGEARGRALGDAMAWSYTYHLTWTCYGQWLRGDVRGYVEDGCNEPGTPYAWGDAQGHNADANRMAETACWLTDAQRRVAEEAIGEACVFRRWSLLAVNVQPDHVHTVLEAPEVDGKRARRILKDRATRALRQVGGSRRRWWTESGKVDAIRSEARLREVVEYVRNRQPFKRVGR
jgi:REP element-mobilizing transposase RayT